MASVALSTERERRTENVFHMLLRLCETLRSAREMASVALSVLRERRTENVFHMLLRKKAANPLRLSIVLSHHMHRSLIGKSEPGRH